MKRKFNFSVDEFYHVYSRGAEKRTLFLDQNDYHRFVSLLYIANDIHAKHFSNLRKEDRANVFNLGREKTLTKISAYCLMPNHIHLLLHEQQENGISIFMKKLLTGYSMYFNKKYSRTGVLFEGRFKAEHAGEDRYLKYLFSYIHLNPIKLFEPKWREIKIPNLTEALHFLKKYMYSSYLDYIGLERPQGKIIDKNAFALYFQNEKYFSDYIKEWLEFAKDGP